MLRYGHSSQINAPHCTHFALAIPCSYTTPKEHDAGAILKNFRVPKFLCRQATTIKKAAENDPAAFCFGFGSKCLDQSHPPRKTTFFCCAPFPCRQVPGPSVPEKLAPAHGPECAQETEQRCTRSGCVHPTPRCWFESLSGAPVGRWIVMGQGRAMDLGSADASKLQRVKNACKVDGPASVLHGGRTHAHLACVAGLRTGGSQKTDMADPQCLECGMTAVKGHWRNGAEVGIGQTCSRVVCGTAKRTMRPKRSRMAPFSGRPDCCQTDSDWSVNSDLLSRRDCGGCEIGFRIDRHGMQ